MLSLTYPKPTIYHKIPVSVKLLILIFATIFLFISNNIEIYFLSLIFILLLYVSCGKSFFIEGMKYLKILYVFIIIVIAWNLYSQNYYAAISTPMRLIICFLLANFFTMTSKLSDFQDFLQNIALKIGMNAKFSAIFGLSVALFMRFLPALHLKSHSLIQSWRARSTKKPLWRIIFPLTLLAVDDAEQLALALRARGGVEALDIEG